MDIQAYIESGTLDAFVLGALPPDEAAQVQADIARYPELAKEVVAIEETLFRFAGEELQHPPAALQDKIWAALDTTQPQSSKTLPFPDRQPDVNVEGTKTVPLHPSRMPTRWNYAAIWVVLLGSVALNAIFWYQNSHQKQQNIAMSSALDSMRIQQQQLTQLVSHYTKSKDMMADTSMHTIVMHTIVKGHPMAATLYWSKEKAEAYVVMNALPQPPKGMQYQLWAIHEGKPMDMGVLPNEMAGTPMITKINKDVSLGEAFAISLEKEGGSPTPTAENIYVLGKAS